MHTEFGALVEEFLEQLRHGHYSGFTLQQYRWTLNHLSRYMEEQGFSEYNSTVGNHFLSSLETYLSKRTIQDKAKVVRHLNHYCSESCSQENLKIEPVLSCGFQAVLEEYLASCRSKGNAEETIKKKQRACQAFIEKPAVLGCNSFGDIAIDTIENAAMSISSLSAKEQVRIFLRYLFSQRKLPHEYSMLIPYSTYPKPVPSVYSPEEIEIIEKSIDRSRSNGRRDYAIFVLISRYGLRPSDVANLRFQDIDFQTKRIIINQVKTKEFLSLPLLEIVELALEDYIVQVRKTENNSECIFLTAFAPYRPLSRAEVSTIIKFAIRKSGIDIIRKKDWALCIACFPGQFNGKRWTSLRCRTENSWA